MVSQGPCVGTEVDETYVEPMEAPKARKSKCVVFAPETEPCGAANVKAEATTAAEPRRVTRASAQETGTTVLLLRFYFKWRL